MTLGDPTEDPCDPELGHDPRLRTRTLDCTATFLFTLWYGTRRPSNLIYLPAQDILGYDRWTIVQEKDEKNNIACLYNSWFRTSFMNVI